jgi:hypothetical protein
VPKLKEAIEQLFIGKLVKFHKLPLKAQKYHEDTELRIEGLDFEVDSSTSYGYLESTKILVDFYCRRPSDNETINVYNVELEGEETEIEFL